VDGGHVFPVEGHQGITRHRRRIHGFEFRILVFEAENPLPMVIKENLIRLSSFVAQKTFEMQNGANAKTIEALTNSNLEISEGLLNKLSH
jgi:Flagellar protein FlaF